MHRAASLASDGSHASGARLSSRPPSPESAAKPDSQGVRAGSHPAGRAAARWSRLDLETIFSHLMIGDLIACSHVNRLWRKVASCPRLQLHCLLQTWPQAHRQQMEQALDNSSVRPAIAPWCACLPEGPGSSVAASAPPKAQELLCAAVQCSLRTRIFYPPPIYGAYQPGTDIQQLVCSPDGTALATASHTTGDRGGVFFQLWRIDLQGPPRSVAEFPRTFVVSTLAFSADSRRLWVLYQSGRDEVLHLNRSGGWWSLEAGPTPLFPGYVLKAVFSPDGEDIAILGRNKFRIYNQREQNDRQDSWWGLRWADDTEPFLFRDPDQSVIQFSDDSRHCVFACDTQVSLATRAGTRWRCQTVIIDVPVRGPAAFDAHGRLLALPWAPRSIKGEPVVATISFWRFEPEQDWVAVREIYPDGPHCIWAMTHPRTHYKVPVVFSPDGELVVTPAWNNLRDLHILPVRGPGAWQAASILSCGPDRVEQGVYDFVQSVAFSSNSQHLAVVTALAVHIWQRGPGRHWCKRLQLDHPDPHMPIRQTWSPDGYHCALAMGRQGEISLWGPASHVGWRRKLYYPGESQRAALSREGAGRLTADDGKADSLGRSRIDRLVFMPDGIRLMMLCFGPTGEKTPTGQGFNFCKALRLLRLAPVICHSPARSTAVAQGTDPAAAAAGQMS